MTEKTSIGVSAETRDRLEDLKEEDDRYFRGEETFDHLLNRLIDAYEDGPSAPADGDGGAGIERVEQALATIEERTGRIEQQLDDLGGGRR